jgi:hypothetical protein
MLVPTHRALAAACACSPSEDLLGLEHHGRAYIVLGSWRHTQEVIQRSVVVHELTHVAMHTAVDASDTVPTSLAEGTASYEEQLYAGRQGYYYDLDRLQTAYANGYSTWSRWSSTHGQWGLSSGTGVELAYEDAFAVVTMVVQRHGGVPAVRRLVREFRRVEAGTVTGDLTRGELTRAFRRATGVPFATVENEAHAWVASGGWKTALTS